MKKDICNLIGIKYPIFQGGMAWVSESTLAAAVSNAGGLGIIAGANAPASHIRDEIKKTKKLTNKPFGLNIMLLSYNADELADIKEKLSTYLSKAYKEHGLNIIYFMFTNIISESTEVIFVGNGADSIIEEAFNTKIENNSVILKGVVSRKKQFIPALLETINGGNA